MKFVCFSNWDDLPDSANKLFDQAAKSSVFFSRPWFESLASTTLGDNQSVLVACVVSEEQVLAILPLMKNPGNTWYSLKHQYTPLFNLLLAKHDRQAILSCMAAGLSHLPISGLIIEPITDGDSNLNTLQQTMHSSGFDCARHFRHYNWIYRVDGQSYADYMAARPSKLRNTIGRKQRKLERDHGYDIRLFTGDQAPMAMADYYTVYSASWKSNEQRMDFVDRFVAAFSKIDWPRLAILYIKNKPVAAQIWFVHNGKASIFRLAYDEAWKRYSTGSILTSFLMKYVIDIDKVQEIDFLTGNDTYKQDWMSERRECYALCFVRRARPVSKYQRFVESLKRMVNKSETVFSDTTGR